MDPLPVLSYEIAANATWGTNRKGKMKHPKLQIMNDAPDIR